MSQQTIYFLSQGGARLNCGTTRPRYDAPRRAWVTETHGFVSDYDGTAYTLSSELADGDPDANSPYTPEQIADIRATLRGTLRQHVLDIVKLQPAAIIDSLIGYADDPADSLDQANFRALRRWRSAYWTLGYAIEAEIIAGDREVPTTLELMALLPEFDPVIWSDGGGA